MNKLKLIIPIILMITCSLSCVNKITKDSKYDCEDYNDFISRNWEFDSDNGIYKFISNPEYWHSDKYVISQCLEGNNKRQIVKLFGKPSKEFIFSKYQYITYCIEKSCLNSLKSEGKQISFYIDSTNKVTTVVVNPALQKINY